MPRPRRIPKAFTGQPSHQRDLVLSTKWINLVELRDHRGKPWRRFYKLETLASAVDKLVRERDRFIQPAAEQLLGQGKLTQLTFTLVDEDEHRLTFHVKAANSARRRTNMAFIVAKNTEEASRRVALESKHLRILAERIPGDMAVPLRTGTIFLPDRYRRSDHHRELEAYLTALPGNFEPLGIHRNTQYMACGSAPHTFSKRETELLKQKMVTIVVSAFHPIKRDGIDTHQLDSSSFRVNRSGKSLPKLKLFNCVHMQTRLTPAKVLGFLLTDTWTSRDVETTIAPEDPAMFYQGVVDAVGKATAAQWITQFVRQARVRKVKGPESGYLDALAELCPKEG